MILEELGQSAELNSYHCNVSPGFCAGLLFFVISDQATVPHEPCEGALHNPASRQNPETFDVIRTLDDLDFELRAQVSDPVAEYGTGVAAVDPEQAQPGKYKSVCAEAKPALRRVRWCRPG